MACPAETSPALVRDLGHAGPAEVHWRDEDGERSQVRDQLSVRRSGVCVPGDHQLAGRSVPIDVISMVTVPGSPWDRSPRVTRTLLLGSEANRRSSTLATPSRNCPPSSKAAETGTGRSGTPFGLLVEFSPLSEIVPVPFSTGRLVLSAHAHPQSPGASWRSCEPTKWP